MSPVQMASQTLKTDTPDDHDGDTHGVDGHCSIQAARAGASEVSTWSTRSAASMNDVDTDEHRHTMARRGTALTASRSKSVRRHSQSHRPTETTGEPEMFPIGAVALDSMQAACPVHRPAVGRSRPRDSVVSAALPSNAAMLHTMTDESRRQRCEDKADSPLTRAAYCSWALMPGRSSSRASFARGRQSASSSRGEPGRSSSRTTQPNLPVS